MPRTAAVRDAGASLQQRWSERTAVIETDAREEAPMSTQEQGPLRSGMLPRSGALANPPRPENPPCPTCQRGMVVRQVTSILFASGLDDVIYSCEKCGTEAKRTLKRT